MKIIDSYSSLLKKARDSHPPGARIRGWLTLGYWTCFVLILVGLLMLAYSTGGWTGIGIFIAILIILELIFRFVEQHS